MSTQGYEEELRSERSYVTGLYARLDAERARVKGRYSAALRGPVDLKNGGTLVDRDAEVRALAKQMKRLDVADDGLCFGRLDTLSGEHFYIGRIGLFDEENEHEPLLLDWRALMRRCPGRSFTVVGDLAQRRSVAGATSWDTMMEPYVPGRWVYRSLSMNYRTPAEIMTVAAALLAEFAPGVQPPESVRTCGVQPWSRRVTEDELPAAIEEFVRGEAGREGTSVVIGPPGVPGAVMASETKGLEFDAVLVVKPERILADGPRGAAELYVALTRATQRLGVLHQGPLPQALTRLTEAGNQRLA